ncbi:MAG: flagellar hook capping FlgD N-terminal domain-containing protein [Rubrivivax sp.]
MTIAADGSTVNDAYALYGQNSSTSKASSTTASADRFLTMLVTQLQNQDPLNPMDNAQMTTQMAQINTVTQLEKVNESVQGLGTHLLQMQALQAASVVGHDVKLEGNTLDLSTGVGRGAVALVGSATSVKVEVMDASQKVVGTIDLGQQTAGLHSFEWSPGSNSTNAAYTFRVTALNGKTAVESSPLMIDRVNAVSTAGNALTLTLARNGTVPATSVVTYD